MNRSPISVARDCVPLRPLRYTECLRVAEIQAQRFLATSGVHGPSVSERIITELPRVRVNRMTPWPTSGMSQWSDGLWLVVINGAEPKVRQRFSLAHELKHIIDHNFADLIYSGIPAEDRHDRVEQICDYFAGCLLMPRPWVKRIWGSGVQHLPTLAQHFGVSQAAMQVRLNQIGLVDPTPRCGSANDDQLTRMLDGRGERVTYFRTATAVAVSMSS